MATLANLRILLGLNAAGVATGARVTRSELRTVQTEASRTQAAMSGLQKTFVGGLGVGAALIGVQSLTSALGNAVGAALDEEKSIARLSASLRANVPAWDGNTEAIERTLAARMRLGFADDEQRASLARLVGATHDVNRALEIQRTAMDLAAFKGIDLSTATDALIRVEGGQFRLLKSLGIELRDNATQTEALAAVQAVAAGQAEELANTTGGKLEAANVRIGESMEKLGAVLLPAVSTAMEGVAGAFEVAGGIIEGFGGIVGTVAGGVSDLANDLVALANVENEETASTQAYNLALTNLQAQFASGAITAEEYRAKSEELAAAWEDGIFVGAQVATGIDQQMVAMLSARDAADGFAGEVRLLTADSERLKAVQSDLNIELGHVEPNANAAQAGIRALADAYKLLADRGRDAADAMELATGAGGGRGRNEAAGLDFNAPIFGTPEEQAEFASRQESENRAADAERRRRESEAAREAERRANEAAREAERRAAEAERERERRAAEEERRRIQERQWAMEDLFEGATRAAHDHFQAIHDENVKAIEDIRRRKNAELDAQKAAVQGAVDAERARIQAIRDRERENELRANVASAETPEDLASANRELQRFLEDQRLGRLQANADAETARIDAERANVNATADLAVANENERFRNEVSAFDDAMADLRKEISRHPEAYERVRKAIGSLVPAGAGFGVASALQPAAPVVHVYVDSDEVAARVDVKTARMQAVHSPIPIHQRRA